MENENNNQEEKGQVSVTQKLYALYNLQKIDSETDKIRIVRGELPLEVQDLEDEIAGLFTRIEKHDADLGSFESSVNEKSANIEESRVLIKKYEEQKNNVRNNREYDSLTKEIEFQDLEIQLSEKRIREATAERERITIVIADAKHALSERQEDLKAKNAELNDIVADTEKEETDLQARSEKMKSLIEDRLLKAYMRIRNGARNGLAVVKIERDACGGCFSKIPPQHQLDIKMHKKSYCLRILWTYLD